MFFTGFLRLWRFRRIVLIDPFLSELDTKVTDTKIYFKHLKQLGQCKKSKVLNGRFYRLSLINQKV